MSAIKKKNLKIKYSMLIHSYLKTCSLVS